MLHVLDLLSGDIINAVISGVLIVPLVIASYYFVQYFRDRQNKDMRTNLSIACVYAAVT